MIENPVEVIRRNLTKLAKQVNSSNTAIIRLCQKLGYKGFAEFKFALSNYAVSAVKESGSNETSLKYITDLYAGFIQRMAIDIDIRDIQEIAVKIINARRVTVMGFNRTGFPASQFAYKMTKLGIVSHLITDTVLMDDYTEILRDGDVCIIFSVTTDLYGNIAKQLNANGCRVILFTMNPNTPIKSCCKNMILLPRITFYKGLSFFDDHALFYVFIEVLLSEISALLENDNKEVKR